MKQSIQEMFNRREIERKLKKRRGKCKKCGKCCENCFFLNKKTKLCRIYGFRPGFICYKYFPLDERDQRIWKVKSVCGYKFRK